MSLPSRHRPDPFFVGRYEGRYRLVTRSLPGRYRPDPLFVGRYEGRYRLVTTHPVCGL